PDLGRAAVLDCMAGVEADSQTHCVITSQALQLLAMTKVLILASTSPRRQQLLREAGIAIEVKPSHIHEEHRPGESPVAYVSRLAREKPESVARELQPQSNAKSRSVLVLGADTTVIVDDGILEKPGDAADARRMLRALSGRAHAVTTAVSLAPPHNRT